MTNLELLLAQSGARPELFADPAIQAPQLEENLRAVHAELDAPRESRLARLLRRVGVPDLTVPLVTATPALRRSWFVAVAIAILFALSVASNDTGSGVERIVVFLTAAPLVPLLGVALAFGKGVDPTHDLVVAAPRDTFTVFLIRAITVLAASSLILLVGSVLLPDGGIFRIAWLIPSIAICSSTLALSTRFDPRHAAGFVGASWILLVVVIANAQSAATMFGPATQVVALAISGAATWFVGRRRERFDRAEATS